MAKELVPDALWDRVKALIPPHRPHPKGGNEWSDDRLCLRGIVFVLRSGIQWQLLPADAFGVSGSTCWRWLRDWTAAGVWPAMHKAVLREMEGAGGIDHGVGVIDSASGRAFFGGPTPGPTPSTAGKWGASGTSSSSTPRATAWP